MVETVIKMSTEVDLALGSDIERLFETVSRMSTGVDELQTNGSLRVEAIIELST